MIATSRGIAALLAAACLASPRGAAQETPAVVSIPAPPEERTGAARGAWERAREAAFAPRRLKAYYRGEVSRKVGAIVRGYLSIFWDGRVLSWRASAPLAGSLRAGRLDPSAGTGGGGPLSEGLTPADAVGALLGVLDLPAGEVEARTEGDVVVLLLDAAGRRARLDAGGRIVSLEFPGGNRVTYEPGEGLPRRIEARGPDGSADLRLESLGPWPEGEPVPGEGPK